MFANKIAHICYNRFTTLPKTGKPTAGEWTILSCIVKEDTLLDTLEVVALGTGTKCIGQNKMSQNGDILNDSHAEVICRRAFLRYLYHQLKEKCIFDIDRGSAKYFLKNNVKFHFFTTHVPCGDAAIFLKPNSDSEEFGECLKADSLKRKRSNSCSDGDSKSVKLENDTFRTGAKCLPYSAKQDRFEPGLDYHVLGAVRTKPGRGNKTLSVSCSDKLAKWLRLGLQGALLMLLLDKPIYLSSLTIAGRVPYNYTALSRALYDRFDDRQIELSNFELHKIEMEQATEPFVFAKSELRQPCPNSIIWCDVEEKPLEVAVDGKKQGITKKKANTKASRLKICKIELFRTFLNAHNNRTIENQPMSYLQVKQTSTEYQQAWKTLKEKCFNVWTVKNDRLLQFYID